MASKKRQTNVVQTCPAGLFIPDHCPSEMDFALYCSRGIGSLHFSRGNCWFSLESGPVQMTFWRQLRIGAFCRIMESRAKANIFGYFDPHARRAVFYVGDDEPDGLLLLFYWSSKYKDKGLSDLIRFYYAFGSHEKTCADFSAKLSLPGFFNLLAPLMSQEEIRRQVDEYCHKAVEEAVDELEKRARNVAYCGHCGGDCSCGADAAKAIRAEAEALKLYRWPSGNNFAHSLDQIHEKILKVLRL